MDRLHQHIERRLTLVSAPAGYGKSTLLADFARQAAFPVVWLTLDPSDRDVGTFGTHMVAALQRQFPAVGTLSGPLLTGGEANPGRLAASLAAEIEEFAGEFFVLVLDDYHEVDDAAAVNEAVNGLLANLPDHCRVVLASRTIPGQLRLARLAAQMQAAGMGAGELAFTVEEVAGFLQTHGHQGVTEDEAARWQEMSHGWAAALVLTQEAGVPEGAPDLRSPRQLFTFLTDEVVGQLEPDLQDFLLQTAVLDGVTPASANALLAGNRAEAYLEQLAARLLFVQRTDHDAQAFRYHPLLREYLLKRLEHEQPAAFTNLHARAGSLAEAEGDLDKAVDYYLGGGHYQAVARLLEERGAGLMRAGRWSALRSWLEQLPADYRDQNPKLLLTMAQVLDRIGETDRADSLARQAILLAKENKDTTLATTAMLALARVLGRRSQFQEAEDLAREALGLLPISEVTQRSTAHELRGLALRHLGKTVQSLAELQYARRNAQESGDPGRQAQVERALASVYLATDDLERAEVHYRSALALWQQQRDAGLHATALNGLGSVESHRGDYEASVAHFQEAYQLLVAARTHPQMEGLLLRNMGSDLRDLRRYDEALNVLSQAEEVAKQCGDNWLLAVVLACAAEAHRAKGQLLEAERTGRSALSWAKHVNSPQYIGIAAGSQAAVALLRGEYELAGKHFATAIKHLKRAKATRELARVLFRNLLLEVAREHDGAAEALSLELFAIASQTELGFSLVVEGAEFLDLLRAGVARGVGGESLRGLLTRSEDWLARQGAATSSPPAAAVPVARIPNLRAYAFGQGRVLRDGEPVATNQWGTAVARELFFLLMLHPAGLRREQIIEQLWPEAPASRATSQFHSTLYRMRHALGLPPQPRDANRYRLPPGDAIWADFLEFEREVKLAAQSELDPEQAVQHLERAVELYRGPFLEDCYGGWAEGPREKLQARYIRAVLALGRAHEDRGELEHSLQYYERALDLDNSLEEVHVQVLRCYARKGEPALAREHYNRYTEWLARELGAAPSPRLAKNYRQLVHGEV